MAKEKILIMCNTYFQLITAIQMKLTMHSDAHVGVVLTDHTRGLPDIEEPLKECKVFNEVCCMECRLNDNASSPDVEHILRTVYSIVMRSKKNAFFGKYFDKLIYFNLSASTILLYNELQSVNKKIQVARFEEGVLSYGASWNDDWRLIDSKSVKLGCRIRQWLGKTNITDYLEDYYCFFPELYEGTLNPIAIPKISEENYKLKQILGKTFQLDTITERYDERYIYFSSVGDFEGGSPVGEFDLVTKIAELVGKKNLLIKTHPRDETGCYQKAGFKVASMSAAPWEAIQLNSDFSEHVFLTNVSGSVLSVNLCMEKGPKTFFMYPLCDNKHNSATCGSETILIRLIERLRGDPHFTRFSVVNHISEVIEAKD